MIRLRVVGVFYDQPFELKDIQDGKNGKTIKELLDLAVKTAGVVDPIGNGGSPLSKFTYTATVRAKAKAKLDGSVASEDVYSLLGFTHYLKDGIATSLGAKKRDAGFYKLFESTSVERDSVTVHAWQYYVIRDVPNSPATMPATTKKQVVSNFWDGALSEPDVSPAIPPTGSKFMPGFTPFDQMPIQDGDEVVWRNVAIVRNPQTEPIF